VFIRWLGMRTGFMVRAGMRLILMSTPNSDMAYRGQYDEQVNQYKNCADNLHRKLFSMIRAVCEDLRSTSARKSADG
jgi:hypothetical protein